MVPTASPRGGVGGGEAMPTVWAYPNELPPAVLVGGKNRAVSIGLPSGWSVENRTTSFSALRSFGWSFA